MAGDEVGRGLEKWEQIQPLNFTASSPSQHSYEAQSLVVIRDSRLLDFAIFPPANHENLHLRGHQNLNSLPSFSSCTTSSLSLSLSSDSFSLSDGEISEPPSPIASDSPVRNFGQVFDWMDFSLEVIRRKFVSMAYTFGSKTAIISSFWTFSPAAGVSLLVLCWLFYRRTQRRQRESVNQLRFTIKKKDEKISHLLHLIAQLNELFLAQQKNQHGS